MQAIDIPNMVTETIKRPSLWLYMTEGIRTFFYFMGCVFFMWFYKYVKTSQPHPVMVVPGFLGSDLSTALLRRFLRKLGYSVYPWGLKRNLANLEDLPKLAGRLQGIYDEHQQPVTLIGWSLGGVYVRELAKQNPAVVRRVITLGSPFADLEAPNHARWIFNLIHKGAAIDPDFLSKIPAPAPVPTHALYSKQDGIVPWEACREPVEDATHQNIQVRSSHMGFVSNKRVFRILAALLQKQ